MRFTEVVDPLWKFWRLPWQHRLLLLEAALWLAIAAVAIAVLPFRYVGLLAARPVRPVKLSSQVRANKVRRVRWAVITAAARAPWRALCFQRGLAAQFMLRRRGVPSVLYYGAVQDDQKGLCAHVWVRDGDVDVVGGEIANRFAILTTFPHQDSYSASNFS
jgi:hypothetical protein